MKENRAGPISAITLGTVQLGTAYGIANRHGFPSDNEARTIIECALSGGVTSFDTARSYGCAESRLGAVLGFRPDEEHFIVTKPAAMTDPESTSVTEIVAVLEASVSRSCKALRRTFLDVVMFHRAEDIFNASGAALDHLERLMERGVVGEIGVSVYTPEDAIRCLADDRIGHLQIPFNLLDRRWTEESFTRMIADRPHVKIHARSVFLQGLLVSHGSVWPTWVTSSGTLVQRISDLSAALGRSSAADLCMAYVHAFPWVTTLVMGVDNESQLKEILGYANERELSAEEVDEVHCSLPSVPARLVDPRQW